jgi:hypothetical protein
MKAIIKFAVGAAIAGALVNMLMKRRSGNVSTEEDASYGDLGTQQGSGATLGELAASNPTSDTLEGVRTLNS